MSLFQSESTVYPCDASPVASFSEGFKDLSYTLLQPLPAPVSLPQLLGYLSIDRFDLLYI